MEGEREREKTWIAKSNDFCVISGESACARTCVCPLSNQFVDKSQNPESFPVFRLFVASSPNSYLVPWEEAMELGNEQHQQPFCGAIWIYPSVHFSTFWRCIWAWLCCRYFLFTNMAGRTACNRSGKEMVKDCWCDDFCCYIIVCMFYLQPGDHPKKERNDVFKYISCKLPNTRDGANKHPHILFLPQFCLWKGFLPKRRTSMVFGTLSYFFSYSHGSEENNHKNNNCSKRN